MDYQTTQQPYHGEAKGFAGDTTPLDRISAAADELARIADYIAAFIDRCRGTTLGAASAGPVPVPSGHIGQIDRLQDNLGRVDKLARELQTIG